MNAGADRGDASPAVVVVAYDRAHCLERLLRSVAAAEYPDAAVPLIISVDAACPGTLRVAQEFDYTFGPKTVLARETHMGLVAHVLACADLVNQYGSVIVLEDDLVLSPHFLSWAKRALGFYADDSSVGGISLYRYSIAETCPAPFEPLDDGSDVHFIQFASSWGQAWTREQWIAFREWDASHAEWEKEALLPGFVRGWTGPSWKRRFVAYLIASSKYFVFPPVSLSTNFGDPGTNADTPGLYQVNLERRRRDYRFARFKDSRAVYDGYFELTPACLNQWTPELRDFDYVVDLYGMKSEQHLLAEHVLTTRQATATVRDYALSMVPNVANVIEGVKGEGIRLARRADVEPDEAPPIVHHYPLASVAETVFVNRLRSAPQRSDSPYLSLVTVETTPGEAESTRRSVSAQRFPASEDVPSVEHVMVMTHDGSDHAFHLWGGPRVVPLKRREREPADANVLWALDRTRGDVMGCVPPGTALVAGALFQVENIFRSLPGISWLASLPGQPESLAARTASMSPHALMAAARRFELPWAGVFWRRSLWNQVMAGKAPPRTRSELWAKMTEEASLQLALHSFVFPVGSASGGSSASTFHPNVVATQHGSGAREAQSHVASPVPTEDTTRVGVQGPIHPSRNGWRGLLRRATEPLLQRDVGSLRFLHTATHLAPYIAIWDSSSGSVTLWHYAGSS